MERVISSNLVFIVHKDLESPRLLCRRQGGFSSLATDDCVFSRQEAWHYVNNHPCNIEKFETYFFRSLSGLDSFLGKTPQEIADCKRSLLVEFARREKKQQEGVFTNERRTKKNPSLEKQGGLFEGMGEYWNVNRESG